MHSLDDAELLSRYVMQRSEGAFATLVERHVSLVYSSALRQVRDPHLAEEITQAVFVILARKAGSLRRETVLAGWLCRTAHFAACNTLKAEHRRHRHEQEAYMESLLHEPEPDTWPQIAPLLDEAVAQLGEADRNAVVLRYYQQKPLDEVGRVLGLNADAAQKRVSRALEKLRKFFTKRGVDSTAATIAETISANSIQAAPVALAKTVTAVAIAKGAAASASTLTLAKGALKIMAWTKAKTAIIAGVVVILAATSTTVIGVKLARVHRLAADQPDILTPLAVNMTFEMQPDFTILFHGIVEETNATSQIAESEHADGADKISRVVDESGQPMKFTKLPGGHSFLLTFPKPVPPGGKIYYAMDGTTHTIKSNLIKPNLTGEYQVGYTNPEDNVADLRYIQTWRLPAGATLLEKASGIEATTNAGQIELRSDQIVAPKGTTSISFRYRLPDKTN